MTKFGSNRCFSFCYIMPVYTTTFKFIKFRRIRRSQCVDRPNFGVEKLWTENKETIGTWGEGGGDFFSGGN